MEKHKTMPKTEGLYWYYKPGVEPEPVQVRLGVNGIGIKAFSGRQQSWVRDGEWLIGPVLPPE